MDEKNTSTHILNASSNLLGICFLVLTSLKLLKLQSATLTDEFATAAMILFMISTIFSFLSIRKRSEKGLVLEKIAEVFFLIGLLLLFGATMMITTNIIH